MNWLFLVALGLGSVQGISVTFVNMCSNEIDLWADVFISKIAPGASLHHEVQNKADGGGRKYKHGQPPSATLAEFTVGKDQYVWYDISIIPTSKKTGPDFCPSLQACQDYTGTVGFNVPMTMEPLRNVGVGSCQVLTCLHDFCEDAYQWPTDDIKTHQCPPGTPFKVIFCPNGGVAGIIAAQGGKPLYPDFGQTTQAPILVPPTQEQIQSPPPPPIQSPPIKVPPTEAPTQAPKIRTEAPREAC